jgi:hypothetical protein
LFSLNPGVVGFFASFLTIHFLLVLLATVIASARGWNLVPFVLLGLSQLPKVYAHATPVSLDPHYLLTFGLVNGTVLMILYVALGLMIVLPRRDPSKSSLPTIAVAVLVGSAPYLFVHLEGGIEMFTGGRAAGGATRATDGNVANAREQTPLPDRLVGRWEGTALIDPEGLERKFEEQETLSDDRRLAPELIKQIQLSVEYGPDGTATTTARNAVVFRDRRVETVKKPYTYWGVWTLIDEKPHSLQIESVANGAVIAITFLGDDAILWDPVIEKPTAFVDGYRLERQNGGLW